MYLKNIMLNGKSQSTKITLNICLNLENYVDGKQISGCQEWGRLVEGFRCDN